MEFKPTYLYIKQHSLTGMKYFGKTSRSKEFLLEKYKGSGKHWTNHLKKHGEEFVTTIWYELFDNKDDCIEFAEFFSEEANIVKSKKWANEKPESGIDGGSNGRIGWVPKQETRNLWIKQRTGRVASKNTKEKMSKKRQGKDNPNALKWTIVDPDKNTYICKGLRQFCRAMDWKYGIVYNSRNGWISTKEGTGKGGRTKND